MPCTVSREDAAYFDRESNRKRFGEAISHEELLTRVACDLLSLIDRVVPIDKVKLEPLTQAWVDWHRQQDLERERKEREHRLRQQNFLLCLLLGFQHFI